MYGWTREEFFEAITHSRINSDSRTGSRRSKKASNRSNTDGEGTDISSVFKQNGDDDIFASSPRLRSEDVKINSGTDHRESGYGSCLYNGENK